jgi:hypothetical protein
MTAITVFRRGGRWAVQDDPDTAPTKEYETRELAELAARQMADGREVVVREEDGGDVGRGGGVEEDGPPSRDVAIDGRTSGAGSRDETPREPQAGL